MAREADKFLCIGNNIQNAKEKEFETTISKVSKFKTNKKNRIYRIRGERERERERQCVFVFK